MPPLTHYKPWTCPCGKRNHGEYFRCQLCQRNNTKPPRVTKPRPPLSPAQIQIIRKMLATRRIESVAFVMGVSRQSVSRIKKKYGPIFDNPEAKVTK